MLLSNSCKYRRQLLTVSRCCSTNFNFSSSPSPELLNPPDKECDEFLPWLEKKAGAEISSKLYIGKSSYGRSLFASQHIQKGDCILEVPFKVQIAPDNLPPEVKDALVDEVDHATKVAMVLLGEWKQGKDSRWAPYISCLPRLEEMHSTIFWSKNELDMICASSVYEETVKQKTQIGNDFSKIRPVLENFPDIFGGVTYEDFMHAYALVESRAWETPKGVSLIPFADFMNHDGVSEAILLNDENKQVSEVVADCSYSPQEEVQISYGKFGNATLMLDFGFTVPHNIHDQVEIQMSISDSDVLHEMKTEILQRYQLPTIRDPNYTHPPSWNCFRIREVKSVTGKGKGIPQSLRAFARVLSYNHPEDLRDLATEAAQNDGRLARRPLKDSSREIRAHSILLSHIIQLIDQYHASIQSLYHQGTVSPHGMQPNRMQMALNLLAGELRILESASAWLANYCKTLSKEGVSA
ncbi:Ribulose-1,5 bisphosphate carboxylase/oxygenase large subunit N-methyltransferase, chloroplastic [Linum perenne]